MKRDKARPLGRKREGVPASRDQNESVFASILSDLVARAPGAKAAALIDLHGETVDYAGRAVPFDLRVAAAHWRIVLQEVEGRALLSPVSWLIVAAGGSSYLTYALPEGYALVVVFSRRAGFARWHRPVSVCARELGQEAGWARAGAAGVATRPEWSLVSVGADALGRPRSVHSTRGALPVEILGAVVPSDDPAHPERGTGAIAGLGLARRAALRRLSDGARAWRVRLPPGIEVTLVRESGGAWYADESLDDLAFDRRDRKSL